MKLRKYRKLLNRSRNGWVWFPWIRTRDLEGRRAAYLLDGQIGNSWGFRVICTSLVGMEESMASAGSSARSQ